MTTATGPQFNRREAGGSAMVLGDWLGSLSEYKVKAVLVLGPEPAAANDHRDVIAVFPQDYRPEAAALARSLAYGAAWRSSGAPLVAWTNLAPAHSDEDAWMRAWLDRGVQSLVRVDFPVPFGQGFECFMLSARQLAGRTEAAAIAWTALSIWPSVKDECIASRFGISPREREILTELARGRTAKDAAAHVGCSERTVTFHLSNVMAKFKVPNKAAAIERACSLGLL